MAGAETVASERLNQIVPYRVKKGVNYLLKKKDKSLKNVQIKKSVQWKLKL